MFDLSKEALLYQERIDPHSIPHTKDVTVSSYKNAFLTDAERILFSSSFRRLQDKAQVYPLEPEDFARTRLTHSLEVSALATSIGNIIIKRLIRKLNDDSIKLKNDKENLDQSEYDSKNNHLQKNRKKLENISQDISICLQCASWLHDIGNPPFGHFGEDIIKKYFQSIFFQKNGLKRESSIGLNDTEKIIYEEVKNSQMINDLVHFDGNAQTIRIVTKLQNLTSKKYGLNLTYAVLGTLFKYPFSSESATFGHQKFGYLYSENDIVKKMKKHNNEEKWIVYQDNKRNPLSLIMEAADDVACIISDFEDAVKKSNIRFEDIYNIDKNIEKFMVGFCEDSKVVCSKFIKDIIKHYKKNVSKGIVEPLKNTVSRVLNEKREEFKYRIADCFIQNYDIILKGDFNSTLVDSSNYYEFYKFLFKIKKSYVFNQEEIILAELQGKKIINFLLDEFLNSVLCEKFDDFILDQTKAKDENHKIMQLISKNYIDIYKKLLDDSIKSKKELSKEEKVYYKIRVVIDQICGMSDTYAKDTYLKLNCII